MKPYLLAFLCISLTWVAIHYGYAALDVVMSVFGGMAGAR